MKQGWKIEKLGDFYDITSSKRVFEAEWTREGVPFYRAREIVKLANQGFVENELFISEEMYNQYAVKYGIPKEGDIMVTGVGTLGICYVVKKNDRFYFKDGNIIWLKTKNGINSQYVEYAFQSDYLRKQIDDSIGATVGTFTIIKAKNTLIPLPPLPEQQRIVSILNETFAFIAKAKSNAEQNLKNSKELFESYLQCVFANKGEGWEEKELREITSLLGDGLHGTPKYTESGEYYFINGNNLNNGEITYKDSTKRVSVLEYEKYKKKLNDRTILVSINGTLGNVAFYNNEKIILGKSACYFNLKNGVNKDFIKYIISSPYYLNYAHKEATGATIKNVSLKTMREFKVPLPSLSTQQSIVKKLDTLSTETKKLETIYQQKLNDLEELKKSILQKAFNGEL
jgi:type I restriction enzyme S subunit